MRYFSFFVPGCCNTQVIQAMSIDEAQRECPFRDAFGFREISFDEAMEIKASW